MYAPIERAGRQVVEALEELVETCYVITVMETRVLKSDKSEI
jgi:hypothetical protein